jgi:hypothetical protein
MHAIRHHIVILTGLVLIWLFIGFAPAAWMAVFLILSIGTSNFSHMIGRYADTHGVNDWTIRLAFFFPALGIVLALIFIGVIFFWFGWVPALGLALMYFAYFALVETSSDRSIRQVGKIRSQLEEIYKNALSGRITREQLEERFSLALQDLPEPAYNLDFLYRPLLAQGSLNGEEYRRYLSLFEKYLSVAERRHTLFSTMHMEVRSLMGLPRCFNSTQALRDAGGGES